MFENQKFDIVIQGGQSNAEGYGRGETKTPYIPDEKIMYLKNPDYIWNHDKRKFTYNDVFTVEIADEWSYDNVKYGDFSLSFAKSYIEKGYLAEDRKILIVRAAIGGTAFFDHIWGINDPLGERMFKMIKYALSLNAENRIVAFLWHQGEDDVCLGNPIKNYYNQLIGLFNETRRLFGNMPIIAADLVHDWKDFEPAKPIRDTIKQVLIDMGNSVFVDTTGLPSNDAIFHDGDKVHFSKDSIYKLGVRYFAAYEEIQKYKARDVFAKYKNSGGHFRIKLIGDSITHGVGGTGFCQSGENFIEGYSRNPDGYCWANLFRDYMREKYDCEVVNNAATGTDIEFTIANFSRLVDDSDDVIICAIGTNNRHQWKKDGPIEDKEKFAGRFYGKVLQLYDLFKKTGKDFIFVANIPATDADEAGGEDYWRVIHMSDINEIYKKVSRLTGCAFISVYDGFTGREKCREMKTEDLLPDGIHPNDEGHKLIFETIIAELGL